MSATLSAPLGQIAAGVLAVWRITHLLWGEDGPFDFFVRLRAVAGSGFLGRLLDCFYCLSLWTAAPLAWLMGKTWPGRVVLWLALSGGAILLERATDRPKRRAAPAATWREEPLEKEPERSV